MHGPLLHDDDQFHHPGPCWTSWHEFCLLACPARRQEHIQCLLIAALARRDVGHTSPLQPSVLRQLLGLPALGIDPLHREVAHHARLDHNDVVAGAVEHCVEDERAKVLADEHHMWWCPSVLAEVLVPDELATDVDTHIVAHKSVREEVLQVGLTCGLEEEVDGVLARARHASLAARLQRRNFERPGIRERVSVCHAGLRRHRLHVLRRRHAARSSRLPVFEHCQARMGYEQAPEWVDLGVCDDAVGQQLAQQPAHKLGEMWTRLVACRAPTLADGQVEPSDELEGRIVEATRIHEADSRRRKPAGAAQHRRVLTELGVSKPLQPRRVAALEAQGER